MAAGLDKDAVSAARAWARWVGSTPTELWIAYLAYNRQPRLFRMPHSRAIINRSQFNNSGVEALAARLDQWGVRRGNNALDYSVGVSIGKTKWATPLEDAADDHLHSGRSRRMRTRSRSTSPAPIPGLRSLQDREALTQLTTASVSTAAELNPADPLPTTSSWRPISAVRWRSSLPVRTPGSPG